MLCGKVNQESVLVECIAIAMPMYTVTDTRDIFDENMWESPSKRNFIKMRMEKIGGPEIHPDIFYAMGLRCKYFSTQQL